MDESEALRALAERRAQEDKKRKDAVDWAMNKRNELYTAYRRRLQQTNAMMRNYRLQKNPPNLGDPGVQMWGIHNVPFRDRRTERPSPYNERVGKDSWRRGVIPDPCTCLSLLSLSFLVHLPRSHCPSSKWPRNLSMPGQLASTIQPY